jgi:hypothetical protein
VQRSGSQDRLTIAVCASPSRSGVTAARLLVADRQASRVQTDFRHLLQRMRQRLYPETMQALAFFWLKTVYRSGYERAEWKALDGLLKDGSCIEDLTPESRQAIAEIRIHLREEGLLSGDAPPPAPWKTAQSPCPALEPEALAPYFVRLLNEWLPKEVARLLICESDQEDGEASGMPAGALGRALERLLIRERLSGESLEVLLRPGLLSPRFVYASEYEILRDVALCLLGRTDAPEFPVLPATLLCVAPGTRLSPEHGEAVHNAVLVPVAGGEELQVPIAPAQARELLSGDQFRVASVVVTFDGRWWLAYQLQSGDQNAILYRPAGRLRIDYSGGASRLRAPWLESRLSWPGPLPFPTALEFFGRRWHVAQWEQDAEHTWLSLTPVGTVPLTDLSPHAEVHLRRARPAFVDMDWSALENALTASFKQNSGDPVEQLRRDQLIPVGRSILALAYVVTSRRRRTPEAIQARLSAVAFHLAALQPEYGRIPWRILPNQVRNVLLNRELHPVLAAHLNEVFDGLPEETRRPTGQDPPLLSWTRLWNRWPTRAA